MRQIRLARGITSNDSVSRASVFVHALALAVS